MKGKKRKLNEPDEYKFEDDLRKRMSSKLTHVCNNNNNT